MAESTARRSIADRSWEVRESLLDILDKAKTIETLVELQKTEDVLDRFKLWTGNLGALHQPHKRMSLESRLADSPEVQDQICEQLDDMQEAAQDLLALYSESRLSLGSKAGEAQDWAVTVDAPGSDPVRDTDYTSREEQAHLILCMVGECLRALFRIGTLVRKATPRDRFDRALQQSEYAFAAQFDINYVEERYPKLASTNSRWLSLRLGNANAKRRQFINYVRDHRAKLEGEENDHTADAATTKQSSKATTFVVPANMSTSEFLRSPIEVEDDSVSLVSASTAFDNETSLRLPSLADLGPDGEYFECPICFTLQSFRKEKAWKLHAYRDLKAYVCTSHGKECEHKMFGDRDTWFNHELKHHRSLYTCKLCACQYTAAKPLQQHILDKHGHYTNEEVTSIIEHGKLVPSQLKAQDCPFCDDWASILSHRRHRTEARALSTVEEAGILVSLTHFKRHVSTHQEQLAVFAVPRTVSDDEERSHEADQLNAEALSPGVSNTESADQGKHIMGEIKDLGPSGIWVHLGGLPNGVRKADIGNCFSGTKFFTNAVIAIRDDSGFIWFENEHDARGALECLNGSSLMGVPIQTRVAQLELSADHGTSKAHVAESHVDNPETDRTIDEQNSTENKFETTLAAEHDEGTASARSEQSHESDQEVQSVVSTMDYAFTITSPDTSPDEEMHGKAVALFDFGRENENELPLVEGQIIWVSYRYGKGWLVAEDPKTEESGLVPEEYVRLLKDIEPPELRKDIEAGLKSLTSDAGVLATSTQGDASGKGTRE